MSARTFVVRIIAAVIITVFVIAVPLVVSGQPQARREFPIAQAPAPEHVRLSSGPFALPSNAAMVDWVVLNDSASSQAVTVTVFKVNNQAAKSAIPPGPLTVTIAANASAHNANEVGAKGPFQTGTYYEIVIEGNSRNLLPSVNVWSTSGAVSVPGTLIPSGSWVRLQ